MSHDASENKQLITRYLSALSGHAKTTDVVRRFVSDPDLVEHIREAEAGFPEYELMADEILAERDLVVMRGTFRGVHRGAFAGMEPTGQTASAALMIMYRIENGRITQHWLQFDFPTLVAQLQRATAIAQTA